MRLSGPLVPGRAMPRLRVLPREYPPRQPAEPLALTRAAQVGQAVAPVAEVPAPPLS